MWSPASPLCLSTLLRAGALVLLLSPAGPAPAAEPDAAHETVVEARLVVDPALSLKAVLDAALARDPGAAVVEARAAETRVLGRRAGGWLADDLAFDLRRFDSGPFGRSGIRETEGGLDLPIWRPGQRAAASRLADGSRAQREAESISRELRVAGDVREAVWAAAISHTRLDQAERALVDARALEAAVARRIELGDAAAADLLPARDWRLEHEARVQEADVVRVHAELAWRLLTGLDRLPARVDELDRDAHEGEADSDPWLAAPKAQLDRARAETDLARRSRGGNPVITLGARRELGGPDNTDIDSLGLGVRIPLGLGAASRVPEAAAAVAAAQAESELALAARRQDYLRHEAEHERHAALRARDRLAERAGLAERELANAAKAWSVGEIGLAERLLVETRARGVLADAAVADLEYRRAIARHHQILGVLP